MFSSSSLQDKIEELSKNLRQGQEQLAHWQKGKMAVSAVPGAGKSYSLAIASALTIAQNKLNHRQYLIVVTYTRSASAAIKEKIETNLEKLQLPNTGFMVQTLHALALNIASRHSELCPINLDYSTLIVPNSTHSIIRQTVEKWIQLNPAHYQLLLEGEKDFAGDDSEKLRRQSVLRTEVLPSLAHTVIREAKSAAKTPEEIREFQYYSSDEYQLMTLAGNLYEQYQILMQRQNLIDYEDLILSALTVLENENIRKFWQDQVFAVFEDEAQDSSPLQEKLITTLASNETKVNNNDRSVNLVRVGDPNQAINSTFTSADPTYFNWFCDDCKMWENFATIKQAGRSSKIIIDCANQTLEWMAQDINKKIKTSEVEFLQTQSLFRVQNIQLVAQKNNFDPEINPPPEGKGVEIYTPTDIYETVSLISERIKQLFSSEEARKKYNLAILVRENNQGKFINQELEVLGEELNLPIKLINDQENFAYIPLIILALLKFIDRPHSADNLKKVLEICQNRSFIPELDINSLSIYPEKFLYPTPLDRQLSPIENKARIFCLDLIKARFELPHYQLIRWLGTKLNFQTSELATLDKLTQRINQEIVGKNNIKTTITALENLLKTEKFAGVEAEESEAEREKIYTKKGQVTIITMHKAKGLDWDYVFLPFLHEKNIPSKPYVSQQSNFLGNFNLSDVSRAMLRSAIYQEKENNKIDKIPSIQQAWTLADIYKQAEEYRLLYVAMTRAKRLLWMSACKNAPFLWNFVNNNNHHPNLQDTRPCPVITYLQNG